MVEVSFRLPEQATVRLTVMGVDGRRVASVHEGPLPAGPHDFCWEGRDTEGAPVPSGVYFLVLRAGSRTMTERVVVERRCRSGLRRLRDGGGRVTRDTSTPFLLPFAGCLPAPPGPRQKEEELR